MTAGEMFALLAAEAGEEVSVVTLGEIAARYSSQTPIETDTKETTHDD